MYIYSRGSISRCYAARAERVTVRLHTAALGPFNVKSCHIMMYCVTVSCLF